MKRCGLLGIPALVMHPGAHLGSGEEAGLGRIAEAFPRIFAEAPDRVTVLLENTACQGTVLGGRFEHLAEIMDRVPQGRFGVCFDTCHAFAAGYDLSTPEGYEATMARNSNSLSGQAGSGPSTSTTAKRGSGPGSTAMSTSARGPSAARLSGC